MATKHHSDKCAVLQFTGQWQGRVEPTPCKGRAEAAAIHDAWLIRAAKDENDDWTARLLLGLLETLTTKQLSLLEFRLCGAAINTQSAVQALALVQLAKGTNDHRKRVKSHLAAFAAREPGQ